MTDSKDKKSVQELIEKTIIKEGDQKSLDQALLLAIKLNLNDFSQNLIERGADSNAKDQDDNTALMLASKHLMPEIVKSLLENGAQVNAINKTGQSALSLVVESKFISSSASGAVEESCLHWANQ
jgi:ankyrin repeat protein